MSVIWIWWISPFGVVLLFAIIPKPGRVNLFEFNVENLSCQYLKASSWVFLCSLPENINCASSKSFYWQFLQFIWILCFTFQYLNFKITVFLFLSPEQVRRSLGVTSYPVIERALWAGSSKTLFSLSRGIELTSKHFLQWYWALLTTFLSNCVICCGRTELQFLGISSGFRSSCFAAKVSNLYVSFLTDY